MARDDDAAHYRARRVYVSDESIIVELRDGHGEIVAPIASVPELEEASEEARRTWRLLDGDTVVEWPQLDLRVSLDSLPPPTLPW